MAGTLYVRPSEAANLSAEDYRRRLAWFPPAAPPATVVLYRPVGPEELKLIAAANFRRFPPRLPDQPIFYPVTNEQYAREIAEQWNVPASGAGHVTRFAVATEYLAAYEKQIVGASRHEEYWIPAEDLDRFNEAIVGPIEVGASFGAT